MEFGLPRGTRIGDFVVDALLGVGGMARVHRAHQVGVDRLVALKVLAPALGADPDFVRRFRREAGTMRDLEHPAILPIYAAGEDAGRMYIAMRLVTGRSLAQLLADGGVAPVQAIALLRPIAEALDHAHARGVVHRDVKPANVLLDIDGTPFLSDFGIAKVIGADTTATGQYLGTPRYMAPEQAAGGAAGHRADLYSLACVAFEVLTGSAPYIEADTVPLLLAHATRPVPKATALAPSLPAAVDGVLARGMAKRPADRYPSACAFVDDLAAAMASPPPRRPRRFAVGATLAALLAATAVLVAVLVPLGPDAPSAGAPPGPAPAGGPAFHAAPAQLADVVRGDLVYEAAMDGTPEGFVVSPATEADSAREGVRYTPGGLELEAYEPGGETYSELDLTLGVTTYLGEMELVVRPGSAVLLCWSLRWARPRQLANYLCVDTAAETATFSVFRRDQGRMPLGEPARLASLAAGRVVGLAVVVREKQLSLYVDGALALDVPNPEVSVSRTLPGLELEAPDGTGLVRIQALRLHALGATA